MAQRPISDEVQRSACAAYASGLSQSAVADKFGISQRAVSNILRRFAINARSRSDAMVLLCKSDPIFVRKRADKLIGKPSGALGKRWKVSHVVDRSSIRGSGNGSWKGGKTDFSKAIRNSSQYARWRLNVFVRDDFTCQHCGARPAIGSDVRLEADHIKKFAHIIDDNDIKSVDAALVCDDLWRTDNGRTLCKPCHRRTPSFGSKRK